MVHLIGIRSCSPIGSNAARLPGTEGALQCGDSRNRGSTIIAKDDLPIVLDGGGLFSGLANAFPEKSLRKPIPLATLAETASSREPGTFNDPMFGSASVCKICHSRQPVSTCLSRRGPINASISARCLAGHSVPCAVIQHSNTPSLRLLYSSTNASSKIDLESKPTQSGRQRHQRFSFPSPIGS